jgi:AcrR family transcriptional regulator
MKHRPDDILNRAAEVIATEGVGVSTARLAKGVGVSNGTLFNYFATKQVLLDALFLHLKAEVRDAVGQIDSSLPLRAQAELLWDRTIEWAMAGPHKLHVSHLLRDADLISPTVIAEGDQLVAEPAAVMARLAQAGILIPLPFEHINAVVQAQIQLTVASKLTAQQRTIAFDAMWRSLTVPEAETQQQQQHPDLPPTPTPTPTPNQESTP